MTKIYFNNQDVFSGLAPTPLVQLSEQPLRYGHYWGTVETITLNGQLTGQCQTFQQLLDKQNNLISNFNQHFKKLEINENGNTVYFWPFAKVKSIDFDSSQYSQLLNFSIQLECYDSGKFSGTFGILEPKNTISYTQQDNGYIVVNHNCSAKGIVSNTSGTGALINAKNYVSSISGWNNISGFTPLFISGINNGTPILSELKENIDRFNNTYSLEEVWTYDPAFTGSGLFRYTTSISSGAEDGIITLDLNGQLEGGFNIPLSNLRNRFDSINKYSLVSGSLIEFSTDSLNQNPISLNINENPLENTINFSFVYDNNPLSNPYVIDETVINTNSNGPSSISLKTTFKWRGACLCNNESGWNLLNSAAENYNYYARALTKWNQYGKTSNLSSFPSSTSETKNKNNCEISIEKEFKEIVLPVPDELEYIDITMSVTPSILKYEGSPVIQEGIWYITNLGYRNRTKYSFNGVARIKNCISKDVGITVAKSYMSNLVGQYVIGSNQIMEEGKIEESESDNKLINFTFTYTAMGAQFSV